MSLGSVISWLYSLSCKFFAVATLPTLLGAFCAVASQVLMAVAAFLPLKALTLAVKDTRSVQLWYGHAIEGRMAIMLLCLAAFACYGLHLLCKRQLERCVIEGARTSMWHAHKLALFEKQDSIAETGYRRFSLGLASLVISLMCLAALAWSHRPLLWGMLGFTLVVLLVALPLALRSTRARRLLDSRLEQVLEAVAGLGLVCSFSYLIVQFIDSGEAVMVGVGSLIVVRQYFRNLTALLRAAVELYRKRLQLTALFFDHQVLIEERDSEDFWHQFEPAQRRAWVDDAVRRLLGARCVVGAIRWVPSGAIDLVALEVEATFDNRSQQLCLRLFNSTRASQARHEAALLTEGVELPRSGFLGALQARGGFHCHVFDVSGFQQVDGKPLAACMASLRGQLLCLAPPAGLVLTYGRSKSYLWQRLAPEMAVRLRRVLGPGYHDAQLRVFEAQLEHIVGQLRRLPLALAQPGMGKGNVYRNAEGQASLCAWDYWVLETVGYGWPADTDEQLDQLAAALTEAVRQRPDLSRKAIPHARMCALLAAFEQRYLRQDYSAALQLLARAVDQFECRQYAEGLPEGQIGR
ncbi:hypothetical protein [Pseudomonas sp. RIT-PI-S]|uniref:hypothetical protein n=1 Tax=Pseudomonas sp. RIT-PI-S TaxID=3035295 RepID=UPI0021DA2FBD|nr:hypothetical protein [Pseudomonas sp. RIT-PI-S]